jgi:hypothetical protein
MPFRIVPLDIADQRTAMVSLPPGGRKNTVSADTWAVLAEIESDDVATVLERLAEAGVAGYAVVPGGQRARAIGHYHLYVDAMKYGQAEAAMMAFLRSKPRSVDMPVARRTSRATTRRRVVPVALRRLAKNDAVKTVMGVLGGAAFLALACLYVYLRGSTSFPTVHDVHHTTHTQQAPGTAPSAP